MESFERMLSGRAGQMDQMNAPAPADGAATDLPVDADSLAALFLARVAATPDLPAVEEADGASVTWGALGDTVAVAAAALAARGVGPGSRVLLRGRGSIDLYAGMLAILLRRAAYVPIDAEWPAARIAAIATQAGAAWMVDAAGALDPAEAQALEEAGVRPLTPQALTGLPVDAAAAAEALLTPAPEDTCYLIFTSGTTGAPKGVVLSHRAVMTYVRGAGEVYGVTAGDRLWQGFSLAFDASVEEIWLAVRAGACLLPASALVMRDPHLLADELRRRRASVFSTVPTLLGLLSGDLPDVRLLIVGGEACGEALVRRWAPGRRMLNTYGPTEASVVATVEEVREGLPVTIGRGLPGYRVVVLDERGRPTAPGATGEIHIGGTALADGYLNRPEETARRFKPDADGNRVYATGDLGRLLVDGRIDFLGRADGQVKLRGYRVELGEVEAVVASCPGVHLSAAAVRKVGEIDSIVVWYIGDADRAAVARHAAAALPAYMRPAFLVPVAAMTRTTGGKIDRRTLPDPTPQDAPEDAGEVPVGAAEMLVADAFAQALGRPVRSRDADFFLDLGGHSLAAAAAISALRDRYPAATVRQLYQHPTVRGLAPALEATSDHVHTPQTRPVSWWRHARFGLAQTLALPLLVGVANLPTIATLMILAAGPGEATFGPMSLLIMALAAVVALPLSFLTAIVAKWVLLGRVRPGRHPLWGFWHWRWWAANRLEAILPMPWIASTPLMRFYARAMGGKVAGDAFLGCHGNMLWDLIEIGPGASLGEDSQILTHRVRGGWIEVGGTHIGAGATVGAAAMVGPDTRMEAGSGLDARSYLTDGSVVPQGQVWVGSPARPGPRPDWMRGDAATLLRPRTGRYVLGVTLLSLIRFLALLPIAIGVGLNLDTQDHFDIRTILSGVAGGVIAMPWSALLLWVARGLVPSVTGTQAIRLDSATERHRWFADRLHRMAVEHLYTVYGTVFSAAWLRALGAKVGRGAEVSTIAHIVPEQLDIGERTFLADAAIVGSPGIHAGVVRFAPTRIGAGAFVGNSAFLPAGTDLAANCLVGVLSTAPADTDPDTDWLGLPPLRLPRRQRVDGVDDRMTLRPRRHRIVQRGAIEAVRMAMQGAIGGGAIACGLWFFLRAAEAESLWGTILWMGIGVLAMSASGALALAAVKWLVVGRFRPGIHPLWSARVWRIEFVTALYDALSGWMLSPIVGTPLLPAYLRLLGARIGRRTHLESTYFCEMDLIRVDDDAAIGPGATLQTHLFEDRVMKLDTVHIGPRASVGGGAVVLYDTELAADSDLGPLSLAMKGERLPAGNAFVGCPAEPVGR